MLLYGSDSKLLFWIHWAKSSFFLDLMDLILLCHVASTRGSQTHFRYWLLTFTLDSPGMNIEIENVSSCKTQTI